MAQKKTLLLHPKLYNIQVIPFVTSSPEVNTTSEIVEQERCKSHFNGTEASNFYNTIISTPSTHKNKSLPKDIAQKSICNKLPGMTRIKSAPKPVNSSLMKNLFFYAQEGNLKEIKKCLEQSNQINLQDTFGWTPIMCAAIEGHYDVVKYLLECGADLSIRNTHGMTVLEIVERGNHVNIADLLRDGIQVSKKSDPVSLNTDEAGINFCKECSLSFKESVVSHEKSIAHLFSSVKKQNSTFYHIPENNKGFQIMLKSGWDKDKGLGINADGRKFPIKTILKKDRSCIGRGKEAAKITHFGPNDSSSIKHQVLPVKLLREKTLKNRERHKMQMKQRQKEIDFRRQFQCD